MCRPVNGSDGAQRRIGSRRVNRAAFKEEEVQKLPDRHIMTLTPMSQAVLSGTDRESLADPAAAHRGARAGAVPHRRRAQRGADGRQCIYDTEQIHMSRQRKRIISRELVCIPGSRARPTRARR